MGSFIRLITVYGLVVVGVPSGVDIVMSRFPHSNSTQLLITILASAIVYRLCKKWLGKDTPVI
jgi:hypothetical protein